MNKFPKNSKKTAQSGARERILVKNGRVIDPAQGVDEKCDVLVENGKISRIGKDIRTKADTTIKADGKIVTPGFVDMHTHLREPGREDAETIETGLSAALAGGFTAVAAMPNTEPSCDSQANVKFLFDRAKEVGMANILPVGTITQGRAGKQISGMGELKRAGCLAVSDDGDPVTNAGLMRRAMEYASMFDLLVIAHCEDKELAAGGDMHEGFYSTVLGLVPIPAEAESTMVARDIQLAELTGVRLHIAHVSTAKSVAIIKHAKARGVKVTAEATPHHFTLTDEHLTGYDANMKVNPPLRSADDVKAVREGLKDGTIDVIATDHAPHPENEKETEFRYAPFGMIGLETALSLAVMKLIDEGYLDWTGLIRKLAENPSKILKYGKGTLMKGASADITVIDPDKEWVYTREKIRSKSNNSPFVGQTMKAAVTDVIVGGKVVLMDGLAA